MELKLSRDCWPCRTRHVRCDQDRVPCGKCLKSGLDCSQERPIRWAKGVAVRGKMQGRAYEPPSEKNSGPRTAYKKRIVFKVPTTGPTTIPGPKLAKTNRDHPKDDGRKISNVASDGAFAGDWLPSPIPALQDSAVLTLDRVSRYYLHYYEQISEGFVLSQQDQHQLKSLVPLALEDQVLKTSLLALASRHLANRWQPFSQVGSVENTKVNRDALGFKHNAIRALSDALRSHVTLRKDTTIAGAFIFILLDLLESGGSAWNHHLKGAKVLLRLTRPRKEATDIRDQKPSRLRQGLRSFLFRRIYLAESLGSVFAHTESTTSLPPPPISNDYEVAQESMEDSFLGCPELLLKAIRFISRERDIIGAYLRDMQVGDRCAHEVRLVTMLDLAKNFDPYKSPFHTQYGVSSLRRNQQETHRFGVLSEVYKLGTLIYGKRVLSVLTGAKISFSNDVSRLLELLDKLRGDRESLKCVLWPVFVAGLECTFPAQREHFITHLEEFWMTTKCLNAVNAAKILRDHWEQSEGETTCWPFDNARFGRLWLLM